MALATGQFTIIDYNDAISLTGYLTSNKPKNIMYNPDTLTSNPEFSTGNLILTPTLFGAGVTYGGNPADILQYYLGRLQASSQIWRYRADGGAPVTINAGGGTTTTDSTMFAVSLGAAGTPGTAPTLTVKKNPFGKATDVPAGPALATTGITFEYQCTYVDPNTQLNLVFTQSIDFTKNSNSASIAGASAWAPQGQIFKNNTNPTLTAQCDLWRGAVIDTSSVQYYWYMRDTTGNTTIGAGGTIVGATNLLVVSSAGFYVGQTIAIDTAGNYETRTVSAIPDGTHITVGSGCTYAHAAGVTVYDATAGSGWRLITNAWPASSNGITGASSTAGATDGTNTITINNAVVLNFGVFKCGIKDVDAQSSTYNTYFWDTITFNDQTDPMSITMFSTGGDVLKNTLGQTVLIAKLFQNGAEIDTITGGAEPPNTIYYSASGSTPASPANPSWWMTTDTGVFKKYTGTWGAAINSVTGANGGPASGYKTYTWSIYDTNGNATTFGATSGTATATRTGKWILIDGNDVTGKATIVCNVT